MVSYGVAKARAMARKSNWNEEEYTSKATITWADSEWEYELEIENEDMERILKPGLKSTPRSLQERTPKQTAQPSRRWLESATITITSTTTRLSTGIMRLGQNSNGNAERGDKFPKHPRAEPKGSYLRPRCLCGAFQPSCNKQTQCRKRWLVGDSEASVSVA